MLNLQEMINEQPSLAAVLIVSNEEKQLARTLSSLEFTDEIVVVENDSTDRTVEIATAHGAKVISHPWEGYAKQRNFALAQTRCDWVLIIDADEVVTVQLAEEIRQVIQKTGVDGYNIAFRNFIGLRPLNHGGWYPDWHLRLVKGDKARFVDQAIHESIDGLEKVGYLQNPILHYTYDSFREWLDKVNRYTDYEALKRPYSSWRLFFKPGASFLRSYLGWGGWKDGWLGFAASSIGAWYVFLTELKRWEQKNNNVTDR